MGENMEKEQWMKESLQMQKASWIQDEITKRREREDELLQQIFMEQKMLQELDEDMDENMAHAREGRKYRMLYRHFRMLYHHFLWQPYLPAFLW